MPNDRTPKVTAGGRKSKVRTVPVAGRVTEDAADLLPAAQRRLAREWGRDPDEDPVTRSEFVGEAVYRMLRDMGLMSPKATGAEVGAVRASA